MKFKGRVFGETARVEFEIMTLKELRIDDLRDFDVDSLKIELRPTSSGIRVVGVWEGRVELIGQGVKKAIAEAGKLRERIVHRIKARADSIRSAMLQMGFKEELDGYGNTLRFTKRVGEYEIAVVVSTTDNVIRVEIYGNDRKVISPEIQTVFSDVEIEDMEVYDLEDQHDERLVINLEIEESEERPERRLLEAIRMIENMLMA
ncbi:hypothetical protein [Thermococcus sp.]|uniref:hypothetical protein n=1 Tax=Thermococcus sp. TaxID=35749 RepID=UPI002627E61C|nr:hypothetical protein [Thermococcus sp.]